MPCSLKLVRLMLLPVLGRPGYKTTRFALSALTTIDIYRCVMKYLFKWGLICHCILRRALLSATRGTDAAQEAPRETLRRTLTFSRTVTTFYSGTSSHVLAGDIGFWLSSGGAVAPLSINLDLQASIRPSAAPFNPSRAHARPINQVPRLVNTNEARTAHVLQWTAFEVKRPIHLTLISRLRREPATPLGRSTRSHPMRRAARGT
ncbi:hypothetical protein FB567DRAFT_39007 [Paraphoma chrysanthemicola]|uniref:Uncharacterized protein n=1 Tax=Paraphoma chrysanthemicola TaxID=798071 RepID=A0A8K0W5C0_9PLEO|nr:hypothetical protein FB567DRAFT_39007 [Paraphoma chrysanthemicola]